MGYFNLVQVKLGKQTFTERNLKIVQSVRIIENDRRGNGQFVDQCFGDVCFPWSNLIKF